MIKIKNSLINKELINALEELIEQDINAVSAFKIARLLKEMSSIFDDKFKMEKKIFDKYLIKDGDNYVLDKDADGNEIPNTYIVSDVNSFNNEMLDLMEIENEINYTKLKFEELGLQTAKIKDLMKIEFLFE